MPGRGADESSLSVYLAFVVHFRTSDQPRRTRFNGRVEHLSSGSNARFSSLKQLTAFFDAHLTAAVKET